MKKIIKVVLFSSFVGIVLASIFFFNIKEEADAKSTNILYAFQVGVFKNKENALNFQSSYIPSKLIYDGTYYRIYIGFTKENKDLLSSYFDQQNYSYYIKEIEFDHSVVDNISKYDTLLKNTTIQNYPNVIKSMIESVPNEL